MSSVVISGDTSGAITLAAPAVSGTNTATLPAATGTVMVSGNMPAFSAYASVNQTISSATWTKVQFQTEEFDTNSNFDNATNYRFTPTVAGYYQVSSMIDTYASGSPITSSTMAVYKNGSAFKRGNAGATSTVEVNTVISTLIYLNGTSDYIEIYINVGSVGTIVLQGASQVLNWFQAVMVRSA